MPFKVVQTLEGKKYKLFTVPSGWEENGVLRYPIKSILKYIKDETSMPAPDWDIIKQYKVKRYDVSTYAAGEKLVSEMLKHSDTEEDIENRLQRRRPQNKKTLDLNSMAQDMMGNIVLTKRKIDLAPLPVDLPNESNYKVSYIEEIPTDTSHVITTATVPVVEDSVSFDITKMFENQKQILDNQAIIVSQIIQNHQQQLDNSSAIITQIKYFNDRQNCLIQKVSGLSVQLENAVTQITSFSQDVLTVNSSKGDVANIPINVKPVDSARELDELEKQLADPDNRARLKNTLSVLCSEGRGVDCAYLLVEVMFTRNFFCKCSWGSRGEDLKVLLKGYKQVLSFFWNMVHGWDQTYSLKDNEMFFKTILKNSKKRKLAKLERASTSRQRSNPKNNLKRTKFLEENETNKTCDNDDSEDEMNEEENTKNKEERNDPGEKNKENNNEKNYSVQENTENNKESNDSVENNTDYNKDINDSVERNTKNT